MKVDEFNAILDNTLNLINTTMRAKRGEYATDRDVLHNFKNAHKQFPMGSDDSPGQALMGMARKHWTSIYDITTGVTPATPAVIDEKFGDALCYLILQKAWLLEQMGTASRDSSPLEVAQ